MFSASHGAHLRPRSFLTKSLALAFSSHRGQCGAGLLRGASKPEDSRSRTGDENAAHQAVMASFYMPNDWHPHNAVSFICRGSARSYTTAMELNLKST
jgi:hypothetical protein